MVFVDIDQRLEKALSGVLEPGETVVNAGFGLHTFSKPTARRIKFIGFYLLGLMFLAMFSDRVFLVITDRRILVIQLTPKYLYRCGQFSLPLTSLSNFEYERSSIYHMLEFDSGVKTYRFAMPNFVIHFRNNGERALSLADNFASLASGSPASMLMQASSTPDANASGETMAVEYFDEVVVIDELPFEHA